MKDKAKYIEAIIDHVGDKDYIYTPLDLCDEMVSSITKLEGNILVVRNLEFIYTLYQKKVDMNTVHYSTNCDIKKQVAIQLGLDINNIYELDYNKKEINLGTEDMKFDVIIQNPPYNPNSLWKKFVLMGIDLLNEDGQMVAIHPSTWRESSRHKKLCNHLKEHVSELHINEFEIWKEQKVATRTDWYLYNKNKIKNTNIYYSNGEVETISLKDINQILRISTSSIPYSIIKKITKENYDNNIIIINTGFASSTHIKNGKYKQCGGRGNGTGWTKGDFVLTDEPTKHQFENKVVMSYAGKPRAQYFSKDEQIGVGKALYWLTDNKSLPILLNSNMFWKLCCKIVDPDEGQYKPYGTMAGIPGWILKSLNFENLTAQTEEELYEHFGLTEEEIAWIES